MMQTSYSSSQNIPVKIEQPKSCTIQAYTEGGKAINMTSSLESSKLASKESKVKKISEKAKNKLAKIVIRPDGTIKPFDEIGISTCTVIVFTNCKVDLDKLFKYTPITDYNPPKKRRGRKKRNCLEKAPPRLPFGSVINIQHELKKRGYKSHIEDTSEEQKEVVETNNRSFFLHCVTLEIVAEDADERPKNVKVYSNGKLQITGCKNSSQFINAVKAIFELFDTIAFYTNETVVDCPDPVYQAVFNTVMQNMDFYMGFEIFRDKLDRFINDQTQYRSIYEQSMNTGCNIKIPVTEQENKLMAMEYNRSTKQTRQFEVNRSDYQQHFSRKNKKNEAEHTFLVFASGHVIFTSMPGPSMQNVFYMMINLLLNNKWKFMSEAVSKPGK